MSRLRRLMPWALSAAVLAARPAGAEPDFERLQLWRPGDEVLALAQTPEGYLWIGTSAGLLRFDGAGFRSVHEELAIRGPVSALATARDGALWAGVESSDGATLLRIRGTAVERWGRAEGLTAKRLAALAEDSTGTIWAGGDSGLWRVAGRRLERTSPAAVRALLARADGLWVGSHAGLGRLRGDQLEPVWSGGPVNALAASDSARLWIGTDGLGRVTLTAAGATVEAELGLARLPHRRVTALLTDREQNLWLGTALGLVQVPRARPFRVVSASGHQVSSLLATPGGVWMLRGATDVARARNEGIEMVSDGKRAAPEGLVGLLEDRQGVLWVGSWEQGLFRLQGAELVSQPLAGWQRRDTVRPLLASARRGLVLGVGDGMLALFKDGRTEWPRVEGLGVHGELIGAAEDGEGRLWLASEHSGLVVLDGAGVRRVGTREGLPSESLTSVTAGPGGSLWIGSRDAGLIRLHGGRFVAIRERDGLGADSVCAPVADGRGQLWIPTLQQGIVRASEAELVAFSEGRAPRVSALLFSAKDGLPANACPWRWPPGAVRDGPRLWLGLVRDAVVFEPAAVAPPPLPVVVIDRVRLDGRDVAAADARVPHGHTVLEVRYSAPLFDGREHLRYRYRLDGLDNEWHEAGEAQEAYYARLPAGRYRFRVAALLDSVTNAAGASEASVAFVLVPAFYRTREFFVALAVALVLAVALAFTLRGRFLRQRFADISEERNRIAREIHDSLEQTLFAAKLQLEAAAGDQGAEARPLSRAVALVHRAIEETRAAVWSLRAGVFGRADLQVAISVTAGEALRGTDVAFSLQVEGTPYRLPAVTEWHVGQIVREAFTNALKHARPTALAVRLEYHAERVVVLVNDDGAGFSPERDLGPGHYGLQGMKERVRPFSGAVTVDSGEGRGTTVRLEIPREGKT